MPQHKLMFWIALSAFAFQASAFAQAPPSIAQRQARQQAEFSALPPEAQRQITHERAVINASIRQINGRETPELVPYEARMQMFLDLWKRGKFRQELAALTPADGAVLDDLAARHTAQLRQFSAEGQAQWLKVAANSEALDAHDLAAQSKAITDNFNARAAAWYRNGFAALSADGLALVTNFAFQNVRPNVTISDPVAMANADAAIYKQHVAQAYKRLTTGLAPDGTPLNAQRKPPASPNIAQDPPPDSDGVQAGVARDN